MKNPLTPAGIEPATFGFVAQHLNHCGTAVPTQQLVPGIFPEGYRRPVRKAAVVTKSGNLNFLEPSGPLQACDGTALPLHLLFS